VKSSDFIPLQSPQVVLVEASAGSGKTFTLAQRYLQLLLNAPRPDMGPLQSILAITFTNKASYEMKERILDFLKKIALGVFSSESERRAILSAAGIDEDEVQRKAYVAMDAIIRNYNFFQVQTIDSFINAILSGCAFKVGLSAHFRTEKNYRQYLEASLDRLIDRASREKEVYALFSRFLRYYLVVDRQTGWFVKRQLFSAVEGLFNRSNSCPGDFIRTSIEARDIIDTKKEILSLCAQLDASIDDGVNASFRKSLQTFIEDHEAGFDIDKVSAYFNREQLPVNKGKQASEKALRLWEEVRGAFRRLCEAEAAGSMNPQVDIFNGLQEELKIIAGRKDIMFLESLNKEARQLMSSHVVELPELYSRLAVRLKHFLIDEFQDTSRLQWQNLYLMIEDALAAGGSLLYVGDKKQAIYRFRGGEVTLIDTVADVFGKLNFSSVTLAKNYRSSEAIVAFNNEVFSVRNLTAFFSRWQEKGSCNLDEAGTVQVLSAFEHAHQSTRESAAKGFVQSIGIEIAGREERDSFVRARLFALLDELSSRYNRGEIALLCRTNDEVELLSSWLLEEGIPVESEKTLNIREHPLIKEIVSFLMFLQSPIDDCAFASFITGEIFCKACGLEQDLVRDFIFSLRRRSSKGQYLYREFRQVFPDVWDKYIDRFFKSVGFVPLYELTVSLYSIYQVLEHFPDYQGFFMRFLELLREQEEEYPDIGSFLTFFSQAAEELLYVNASHSDAVRVLTIHKAKGLEFPLVIIPFLEMNVKTNDQVIVDAEGGYQLLRVKERYAEFSPFLRDVYQREYRVAVADELNAMYVALTRAQEELYLFVPIRASNGGNPASLLLPQIDSQSGTQDTQRVPRAGRPTQQRAIAISRYTDWVEALRDEFSEEPRVTKAANLRKGEFLHAALAGITNLHTVDEEAMVSSSLERATVMFAELVLERPACEKAVRSLISHASFRTLFDVADGEVFNEKEIVDERGRLRRIDRLIVTPKDIIIIDYKSSRDDVASHREQVGAYMAIMRQLYPGRRITGKLLYLDDFSCENI
jgi:ATP-dependent helicase/nuclease subunit A